MQRTSPGGPSLTQVGSRAAQFTVMHNAGSWLSDVVVCRPRLWEEAHETAGIYHPAGWRISRVAIRHSRTAAGADTADRAFNDRPRGRSAVPRGSRCA